MVCFPHTTGANSFVRVSVFGRSVPLRRVEYDFDWKLTFCVSSNDKLHYMFIFSKSYIFRESNFSSLSVAGCKVPKLMNLEL